MRKRRPSKAKKCKKAVPEGLEEDAGRKVCREDPPKGDVNFWVRLRVAIWRHVGLQKRGQERQKFEKNVIFVCVVKVCTMNRDSETIWERFSERAERQKRGKVMECLLEMTFQPLQDNIEIGTVLGSILGGLGLHFREDLGSKTVPREVRKACRKRDENEIDKKSRKSERTGFRPPPPPYPLPNPPPG